MSMLPPVVAELRLSAQEAIREWQQYGAKTERALTQAAAVAEAEATKMEASAERASLEASRAAERASLETGKTAQRAQLAAKHAADDARLAGDAAAEARAKAETATAAAEAGAAKSAGAMSKLKSAANTALIGTAVAMAGVGYESVKMATEFQTSVNLLATGAGESRDQLGMVSKGLLDMSGQVGISAEDLAKGMYLVESAGFHAQKGLDVMRAAAEGAKTDGADAAEVANALTTVLTDLGSKAGPPAEVMSKMVAAVGAGKMRMNDLAASIHSVLPNATALGISFDQVGGALATMTAQGISAQQAAQNLNHMIVSLAKPTRVQTQAMAAYGLSSLDVSKNLGKRGLTGTLDVLYEAIMRQSKGGVAMQNAFMQNKVAAEGLISMYSKLPPEVQKLADEYTKGSISAKQFDGALDGLPLSTATQAKQFIAASKNAGGFSQALRSGKGDLQTITGAMADMTGGMVGLQTALHLTGENADTFSKNVEKIKGTTAAADGSVKDFEETQKNFGQQLAQAKAAAGALAIEIGMVLIPPLSATLGFFQKHTTLTKVLGVTLLSLVGTLALVGAGLKVFAMAQGIAEAAKAIKAFEIGTKLAAAATKVWAAAQWALTAAMDANPIGLIVIAVAALVAGVIYAYQHFGWFRDAVNAVGSALKGAFLASVHAAVAAWDWLSNAVSATVSWFQALPGRIWAALQALPGMLLNAAKMAVMGYFYMIGYGLGLVVKEFFALPGQVMSALNALWNLSTSLFSRLWNWLVQIGAKMTLAMIKWGQDTYQGVTNWFQQLPVRIATFLFQIHQWIVNTGARIVISSINWARDTINGVVNFFSQLPGRVMSFVSQVPGKIQSAFSGAGQWLYNAGQQIVQGLLNGLSSMASSALGAVKNLGSSMLSGFKDAMGIHSPSTKFAEIARWIPAGIAKGMEEGQRNAVIAVQRMTQQIHKTGNVWAENMVASTGRTLVALSGRYDAITARMKSAQSQLASLVSESAKMAADVADKMRATADVTRFQASGGGVLGVSDIIRQMQAAVNNTQQFGAALKQLKAQGLDATTLAQLAQAGPEQGMAAVNALLSGGPDAVRQVAELQRQMGLAATSSGQQVADAMYGSGIQAAQGLVAGLRSQEAQLMAQINRLAKAMVDGVRRALKIRSPSAVFADQVGQMIPAGIAAGIVSGIPQIMRALEAIPGPGAMAPMGGSPIGLSGPGAAVSATGIGGARSGEVVVPVTVTLDNQVLFRSVQRTTLQYNRRNPNNGLSVTF